MTTSRALILLIVLIGILFGLSLALGSRNSGGAQRVNPADTWLAKLAGSQQLDFAEVSATNRWENGHWTIPQGIREACLQINPSKHRQAVRRVKISLNVTSGFTLQFAPQLDKEHQGEFVDAQATELTTGKFPVELTVLEHGGVLRVTRDNAISVAVFTFEQVH
jgi:hypothetical protein